MPSKLRKAVKGIGKVAGLAANFVPGGAAVKGALGLAGKFAGGVKGGSGKKHRRKGAMYYLKRIPVEKAKARLTKIKMSAYKGL